jgi:hypothetical protein
MEVRVKAYQRLEADNDPSGNAQRLFMVYEQQEHDEEAFAKDWTLVEVYDEGSRGRPDALRMMGELPRVRIPKREYHSIYRMAQAAGILRYS